LSTTELFNSQLLKEDNPFPFPELRPIEKPRFMVGGDQYIEWFKNTFKNSVKQGYVPTYIVGEPSAGKTHLLRHLKYLFYESNSIDGLYAIYEAFHYEFRERDLWVELLASNDAVVKFQQIVTESDIAASGLRPDTKEHLLKLKEGSLRSDRLDDGTLHAIGKGLSELLITRDAGICIAIDNLDEYIRFLSDKYEVEFGKGQGRTKALEKLLGTVRSLTTGLPQIVVLLAMTTPVFTGIEKETVDMTHLRRFVGPPTILRELSESQSVELVWLYLKQWSDKHRLVIPTNETDCLVDISGQVSIYPFTSDAIKYFYAVTRHMAGDIVAICGQCINDMRNQGQVYVVKDEFIIRALELAEKERGGIIQRRDVYNTFRVDILERSLAGNLRSLEQAARAKYIHGIEPERITRSLDEFAALIGIEVSQAKSVKSYSNPAISILPDSTLKVWKYKGKAIATKYILGKRTTTGQIYTELLGFTEVNDIVSLIEGAEATHGLFISYKVAATSVDPGVNRMKFKFDPILEFVSLDNDLFKIVALVEDGGEKKNDLATYADKFVLNLSRTLDELIMRTKPPEKPKEHEKYTRYY